MADPAQKLAFTTSVRTQHGRLLIHITGGALRKLRHGTSITDLALLNQHIERLKLVALAKAALTGSCKVEVDAADI